MFVDAEEMLKNYLQPVSPGNVAVEMPNAPTYPFVLIARVAGGDDQITECATVDVAVFHTSKAAASTSARQMHLMMHELKPYTLGLTCGGNPVRIERAETVHGPIWVNYKDENVDRYIGRYDILSRFTSQP